MANLTGQFEQLGNQMFFKLPTNMINVNPFILVPSQPVYMPCNLSYFPQNFFIQPSNFVPLVQPIPQSMFALNQESKMNDMDILPAEDMSQLPTLQSFEDDLAPPVLERQSTVFEEQIPLLPNANEFLDTELEPPKLEPANFEPLYLKPETSQASLPQIEKPTPFVNHNIVPFSASEDAELCGFGQKTVDIGSHVAQVGQQVGDFGRKVSDIGQQVAEKLISEGNYKVTDLEQLPLAATSRSPNDYISYDRSEEEDTMDMPVLELNDVMTDTSENMEFPSLKLQKQLSIDSMHEMDSDISASGASDSDFKVMDSGNEKNCFKSSESAFETSESSFRLAESKKSDSCLELVTSSSDVTKENKSEIITKVEKLDESSSSGVSSANSSLWNDSHDFKMDHHDVLDTIKVQPLTSVHNIAENVMKRRQKPTIVKKKKATQVKRRGKATQFNSNWRSVDEGVYKELRLPTELQYKKRICYNAIRHSKEQDEIIRIKDCVRVCSSEGLENIGKIFRIFYDEETGNICAEVMWYYTQQQIPDEISLMHNELLASKHIDVINVDSIEEHAFVLSYSEYCRFIAETRIDEMPPEQRPLESRDVWPRGEEEYQRRIRLPHEDTPMDLIYFCRNVYSLKTRKLCLSILSRRSSLKSNRRPSRSHR
ncbi:unnamed protein product [Bursaphelenchus okinawaensis]|uniref:BAH domain-containing protein n=1 Tax=Bursaphelenchus okinawaensis TaxID=465554 RepID=A0A811LAJ6_9BILA|nr:unnamed protein product [Bursaphelenchus okinawaensis]CAG9120018.1 unnamed protein product [Bursaphelenchus okinawaensis]